MASIGENIRKYRKAIHISQAKLAELAGIHEKAIYFYESGKRQVPSEFLKPIADVLGISVDKLLSTDEGNEELEEQIMCAIREVLKGFVITKK